MLVVRRQKGETSQDVINRFKNRVREENLLAEFLEHRFFVSRTESRLLKEKLKKLKRKN